MFNATPSIDERNSRTTTTIVRSSNTINRSGNAVSYFDRGASTAPYYVTLTNSVFSIFHKVLFGYRYWRKCYRLWFPCCNLSSIFSIFYIEEHKATLIPVFLPTASPEFMVLEECWNISKDDLLVLTYYTSFTEFRKRLGQHFRTKHFNLNMRNYLTRNMSGDLS